MTPQKIIALVGGLILLISVLPSAFRFHLKEEAPSKTNMAILFITSTLYIVRLFVDAFFK